MRIAQVAPLYESVPPRLYGGTERVVSYLTEELAHRGHDVSLFASGDSVTRARLHSPCPRSLRLDRSCHDPMNYHILMVEQVLQVAAEFDVIHFHTDYTHFPSSRRQSTPVLHTLHGRLDVSELVPLFEEFRDIPLVSISDAQRAPLPRAHWQATVYHGLPPEEYTFQPRPGDYFAFLGRISPEKQVHHAIEIARRTGMQLKIAAKIDRRDRDYYETVVRPLMADPLVEYLGEIGGREKDQFLGGAYALLFPINWPEPFGLVMIEALACGTPVIAYPCGSVPEVLDHGVTGFIVEDLERAVEAVGRVQDLDRGECRATFERRFTVGRMTDDYLAVYERLFQGKKPAMTVKYA